MDMKFTYCDDRYAPLVFSFPEVLLSSRTKQAVLPNILCGPGEQGPEENSACYQSGYLVGSLDPPQKFQFG